ncbi:hypothetical protein [Bacillus sp. EB01]|uniref:hypothetical protein n=1 Tax=Bacillus sp. EB01 TaxID=1347086 RepID=UPI0005C75803|nr:hypothetical protein [Bacillus sp. EB01]
MHTKLDEIVIEVGIAAVPIVDGYKAFLSEEITGLREKVRKAEGIDIPDVYVRSDINLFPLNLWNIKINNNTVYTGSINSSMYDTQPEFIIVNLKQCIEVYIKKDTR